MIMKNEKQKKEGQLVDGEQNPPDCKINPTCLNPGPCILASACEGLEDNSNAPDKQPKDEKTT